MKALVRILPILLLIFSLGCSSADEAEPIKSPLPTPTYSPEIVAGEGDADVLFVSAEQVQDGSWTFSVTVSHPDTGWEDYADGWDVVLQDGTVLKPDPDSPFTRLLLHPHVDEQPFTRSQSRILIPDGERYVVVRAHDLVDGFGGQAVVVDLSSVRGELFEVARAVSAQPGTLGLTNQNLDGNRYLTGTIDLSEATLVEIPLGGSPSWVVGLPLADGIAIWLVALEDGILQAFQVGQGEYAELQTPVAALEVGAPPAIVSTHTGFDLLNAIAPQGSDTTSPIISAEGHLVFISAEGALVIQGSEETNALTMDPLPDGRILSDEAGNLLLLSEPSSIYGHGVLGDGLEARAFTLVMDPGGEAGVRTFQVPNGQVIEGIAPIWADLDGDGTREIIVTLSDDRDGARLVVYSPEGEILARSRAIGSGYRWRHQIAAAPFGPDGEIEIVDVLTPHLGGVVEFFQIQGADLVKVAQVSGYTSHVIGSRNLDMALAADVDADGQVELLLPNQQLTSLAAIQRTEGGVEVDWEIGLEGSLSTNIGAVAFRDGTLGLAVGLESGKLWVWLP
jgi:hypothetical protein